MYHSVNDGDSESIKSGTCIWYYSIVLLLFLKLSVGDDKTFGPHGAFRAHDENDMAICSLCRK